MIFELELKSDEDGDGSTMVGVASGAMGCGDT
jgi:hypothetical protein